MCTTSQLSVLVACGSSRAPWQGVSLHFCFVEPRARLMDRVEPDYPHNLMLLHYELVYINASDTHHSCSTMPVRSQIFAPEPAAVGLRVTTHAYQVNRFWLDNTTIWTSCTLTTCAHGRPVARAVSFAWHCCDILAKSHPAYVSVMFATSSIHRNARYNVQTWPVHWCVVAALSPA